MLVPNQIIKTTWMPANREHYIALGYEYTKMRLPLEVKAEELPDGSQAKVRVICDYCGKEIEKAYHSYIEQHDDVTHKDCCKKCQSKKNQEITQILYGVDNIFQLDSVKEKSKQTCLEKYGVENVSQSQEIKEKIFATNIEKYGGKCTLCNPDVKKRAEESCVQHYGVVNPFSSAEIQEKIKQTNLERYGEGNIAHTPKIAEKIRQTNLERYGVPYSTQATEVIAKMRESFQKNGSVPSSQMEKDVCKMLAEIYGKDNCVENFALGRISMDCLLNVDDVKIDVEYDGWHWHKNKQEYDKRRNYWVVDQGYKILRIRSNNLLPTHEQIKEAVDYLVKGNHTLTYIDLDI